MARKGRGFHKEDEPIGEQHRKAGEIGEEARKEQGTDYTETGKMGDETMAGEGGEAFYSEIGKKGDKTRKDKKKEEMASERSWTDEDEEIL